MNLKLTFFLKSHNITKHDKDWKQEEYDQIFKKQKPPSD